MRKKEFCSEIAKELQCSTKEANAYFDGIVRVMQRKFERGESVKFPGLFIVSVIDVPEMVRHSGVTDTYVCPAHKRLHFTVSDKIKDYFFGRDNK